MKELTDKKKEAGTAPRISQAGSNKFNVPIPKIQPGTSAAAATTTSDSDMAFELTASSPATDVDSMQETMAIDVPFAITPTHHHDLSVVQPPSPPLPSDAPTGLPSETHGLSYDSVEEATYHPGFDLPPLDLDLFNMVLEKKLIPGPTAEEVAAYLFLKQSLGK